MTMRVLRKRHARKVTNRPPLPLCFTLRVAPPIGSGSHARYPLGVTADGGIDREAWAQVVARLIRAETNGKIAPFARKVGFDARTVDRWLRQDVAVTEESIRKVARALGLPPIELLVQVGYYRADEITQPAVPDPRDDVIVQQIRADRRLTDEQRNELVEMQLKRIEDDFFRRKEDYQRLREILERGGRETA